MLRGDFEHRTYGASELFDQCLYLSDVSFPTNFPDEAVTGFE